MVALWLLASAGKGNMARCASSHEVPADTRPCGRSPRFRRAGTVGACRHD